ncbi:MAG: 6-phosphogluconolactonase [archaeon]
MQIIKTGDVEEKVAEILADKIHSLLEEKEYAIISVPGGRSAAAVFAELVRKDIDWERTHWFMVDERMVDILDKESNFKVLKNNMPNEANLHPFLIDSGVGRYERELTEYQDYFDIAILSVGEDGHVASLFPKHPSIGDDSEFFIVMDDSPKLPRERMSSSRLLIERSGTIVLLFKGESKRKAYEQFFDKKISVEQCPAKLVNVAKEVYVVTDLG